MPNTPSPRQRIKICFIGLYAYPLFNADCISPFGGSEVRVSLLAKELARRGNVDVSLITFDHGQPHIENRDGVRIISWTGWHCPDPVSPLEPKDKMGSRGTVFTMGMTIKSIMRAVIRPLRETINGFTAFGRIDSHFIPRSRTIIFDEADADIYIIPGNSDMSAELAYYCREKGKKSVLLAGSDIDFDPGIGTDDSYQTPSGASGFLMRYAIYNMDAFILQTERQRSLLQEYFQREGIVIRNPMDVEQKFPPAESSAMILWVGKSDGIKRPELALELAEIYSQYAFTLVMSFSSGQIHDDVLGRANGMPNVTILPYIPYDQVEEYYANAGLLINTSLFEGFPNAFLQAAKYGVPILSLNVDPGGMLTEHGCGRCCNGDFEAMKSSLVEMMEGDVRSRVGANGLEFVRKYHDKTVIAGQFEEALLSVVPADA